MEIEHNLLLCGECEKKATSWSADCDRIGLLPQCFCGAHRGNPIDWL